MIPRIQSLFDRYGIKPTYLVNYPVVSCDWAVDMFSEIMSIGKCEIGTHLHPWNTPPLNEDICEKNSMMKNLPYELQIAKLSFLTDAISSAFGKKPLSFRAGRWALGPDTIKALIACGYQVDSSVTPTISWRNDGDGAEYLSTKNQPYWLSTDGKQKTPLNSILEVPVSIGFNRWQFEFWQKISLRLRRTWLRYLRLIGLLHRGGLLRKIWLSPEVSSAEDMISLSKVMIKNGYRFLNLTFHSNVLLPGKTPFVKSHEELKQFYLRIEKFLEYLTSTNNVVSLTLSEVGEVYKNRRQEQQKIMIM